MSRIEQAIRQSKRIAEGETVVVGFSGGADSTALLHALHAMRIPVIACHVNHCLRGEESDRDEAHARAFCESLGIPFERLRADVKKAAAEQNIGEEEAGRLIRYGFFEEIRQKYGAAKIATAHTLSDQAETVLHRLVRGSGMRGLSGIPEVRGCIVRPLLSVTREEVEAYCRENALAFVEDSTNRDLIYARNRIRHETLPSLKAIQPNAAQAIARTAQILAEEDRYMETQATAAFEQVVRADGYDAAKLRALPLAIRRRVAGLILQKECGTADFAACEALLHLITMPSGRITVHKRTVLAIRKDRLFCEREDALEPFSAELMIGGITEVCGRCVKAELVGKDVYALYQKVYKNLLYLALDYDTIKGKILVRQKRDGDRIAFSNRGMTKPLKKWFSEAALTAVERSAVMVFADTEQIIGVWGFGASREHAVTPASERILIITDTKMGEDKK